MNELRGRLIDLWAELEGAYPHAVVHRSGFESWDLRRLRFEVWYAEWQLRILAEGVKAGWQPPYAENVSEGWAA